MARSTGGAAGAGTGSDSSRRRPDSNVTQPATAATTSHTTGDGAGEEQRGHQERAGRGADDGGAADARRQVGRGDGGDHGRRRKCARGRADREAVGAPQPPACGEPGGHQKRGRKECELAAPVGPQREQHRRQHGHRRIAPCRPPRATAAATSESAYSRGQHQEREAGGHGGQHARREPARALPKERKAASRISSTRAPTDRAAVGRPRARCPRPRRPGPFASVDRAWYPASAVEPSPASASSTTSAPTSADTTNWVSAMSPVSALRPRWRSTPGRPPRCRARARSARTSSTSAPTDEPEQRTRGAPSDGDREDAEEQPYRDLEDRHRGVARRSGARPAASPARVPTANSTSAAPARRRSRPAPRRTRR